MKYGRPRQYHLWAKSHPSRGAWIEMEKGIMAGRDADAVAPHPGGGDLKLEFVLLSAPAPPGGAPPAGWIEIGQ